MWFKKRKNRPGYDYFSHHVDDFLITGFGLKDVLARLKDTYTITGGQMPEQHLGMSLKRYPEGQCIEISSHMYVQTVLTKVKEVLGLTNIKRQTHLLLVHLNLN